MANRTFFFHLVISLPIGVPVKVKYQLCPIVHLGDHE